MATMQSLTALSDRPTIAFVSLGCPKNLVDTERMMDQAARYGAILSGEHNEADIVVINTCGFLEPAKDESLSTIDDFVKLKAKKKIRGVIVAGCMTERYLGLMQEKFPSVDGFLQTKDFSKIGELVEDIWLKNVESLERRRQLLGEAPMLAGYSELPDYNLRSPGKRSFAYIKISEGCNRTCSFCIIPKLRGKLHSRSIEGVVKEVEDLVASGTKEVVFIAQDLTSYGRDRNDGASLLALLNAVEKVDGLSWYRLMYNYPRFFTDEVIATLSQSTKFARYIDMPLQHVSDRILAKMKRPESSDEIRILVKKLREQIPGVFLRTTLMVGFPGETEDDFQQLKEFVETMAFDHLGVFTFCREEGTPSYDFPDQVADKIKRQRLHDIMKLQKSVSRRSLKAMIGQTTSVMLDILQEKNEKAWIYRGRHIGQAPEVDGMTYVVSDAPLEVGEIVDVQVNRVIGDYDLLAQPLIESAKAHVS